MKNVTYISAGAGSGKTYTLTKKLNEILRGGKAKPEQVILTTFTEKASADFKERAKGVLYENGMYAEANGIDQAMIGTIHGVAYSFIRKYWYYLGLAPEMGVLTDDDADVYISQSLADLPNTDELELLTDFARYFSISYPGSPDPNAPRGIDVDFWKSHLKDIIGYTTNFGIDDYKVSRQKSLDFLRRFVGSGISVNISEKDILAVTKEHEAFMLLQKDSKANQERLQTINEAKRNAANPTIEILLKLARTIGTPKGYGQLAAKFKEDMALIWQSKHIYDKQEKYINLIFDLALRWQGVYADFKRQRNLLDYNDMEKYFLQLLQHPEVEQDIRDSYKYLFVDEFQDCSPIQVKIFDKLSEMVCHSYWVGDYKQAIYGFRGSDTMLTKAVVDKIERGDDGCEAAPPLADSYRSQPAIVNLCNNVFKETFDGILTADKVILNPVKEQKEEKPLRWWSINRDETTIPMEVYHMIAEDGVRPEDIAILSRNNWALDEMIPVFAEYGIPVNRSSMPIMDKKTTQLVMALLALIVNDRDTMARSQVAYFTEQGYTCERIMDKRLDNLSSDSDTLKEDYLNNVELIDRLLAIRHEIQNQSVGALVESMIVELGLYDRIKAFGNTTQDSAVLDTIIRAARQYETICIQTNKPATVTGFMQWLSINNPVAEGNPEGVNMLTYHGAKGLEWKHVILMSLENDPSNENKLMKREIYGVHAVHDEHPTADNLFPVVYIMVTPWIFGPDPFGNLKLPEQYVDIIREDDLFMRAKENALSEANRLLYVGMTRASCSLTLALKSKEPLLWPMRVGANVSEESYQKEWNCFGSGDIFVEDMSCAGEDGEFQRGNPLSLSKPMDDIVIPYCEMTTHKGNRDLTPSLLKETKKDCKATIVAESNNRIPLHCNHETDYALVGTCIHQIFANIENNISNESYITNVINDYGMGMLFPKPSAIVDSWKYLVGELERLYGPATSTWHERPFRQMLDERIYNGSIDFCWETENGTVLVDFKTCPKGKTAILDSNGKFYAGHYQPQFECYANALKAARIKVLAQMVYYPVSGLLVELHYE